MAAPSGDGVRAPRRPPPRPGTTREASQGPPTPSARRPESRDRAPASQASNTTILESLSAPDPVSPGIGPKSEKRPPAAIILRNEAFAPSEGTATLQNAELRTREEDPQHEADPEPRKRYSRDNIQQRVGPLRVHDLRGRIPVSFAATASERVVRRDRRVPRSSPRASMFSAHTRPRPPSDARLTLKHKTLFMTVQLLPVNLSKKPQAINAEKTKSINVN